METTSTPVVKNLVRCGAGLTVVDCICGRIADDEPLVLKPPAVEKWITYATIHLNGPRPTRSGRFIEAMRTFIRAEMTPDGNASMLRLV